MIQRNILWIFLFFRKRDNQTGKATLSKLKESGILHCGIPDDDGTNSGNLTFFQAGFRQDAGFFCNTNDDAAWWSST
jgi:hypothetical protein